jgi:hypothetical protein
MSAFVENMWVQSGLAEDRLVVSAIREGRLVIKQTRLDSLFELLDYKQIKQTKRCILECTNKSNVQSKFV